MALTSLSSQMSDYCLINVEVERQKYFDVKLCFLICVLLLFLGKILWGNTKMSVRNLGERGPLKCVQIDYILCSSTPTNLAENCLQIDSSKM